VQIVSGNRDVTDSFVIQWAQRWLPEDGKYRSVDATAVPPDQTKVDNLLVQLLQGQDLRTR
jgi:hypothetical protein